jgi:hypothetical protein
MCPSTFSPHCIKIIYIFSIKSSIIYLFKKKKKKRKGKPLGAAPLLPSPVDAYHVDS